MIRLFLALVCGSAGLLGCGASTKTPHVEPPRVAEQNGHVRLILDAIDDPNANKLEPAKVLRATIQNDIAAEDRISVEKGLTNKALTSSGVLALELRVGDDVLKYSCLPSVGGPRGEVYLDLGPGESITRIVDLACYRPPTDRVIIASATYLDDSGAQSVARPDSKLITNDPSDSSPCPNAPFTRPNNAIAGPVVSNEIRFVLPRK